MLKHYIFLLLVLFSEIQSCRCQTKVDILREELTKKQEPYKTDTLSAEGMHFKVPVFDNHVFNDIISDIYEKSRKEDFENFYSLCEESKGRKVFTLKLILAQKISLVLPRKFHYLVADLTNFTEYPIIISTATVKY